MNLALPPDENFTDTFVEISVDGIPMPQGYIGKQQSLWFDSTPKQETNNTISWEYCIGNNWESGRHNISLHFHANDGVEYVYDFDFEVN